MRTLTYRLERIHRLTGADPADPEHRYVLQGAVIGARRPAPGSWTGRARSCEPGTGPAAHAPGHAGVRAPGAFGLSYERSIGSGKHPGEVPQLGNSCGIVRSSVGIR